MVIARPGCSLCGKSSGSLFKSFYPSQETHPPNLWDCLPSEGLTQSFSLFLNLLYSPFLGLPGPCGEHCWCPHPTPLTMSVCASRLDVQPSFQTTGVWECDCLLYSPALPPHHSTPHSCPGQCLVGGRWNTPAFSPLDQVCFEVCVCTIFQKVTHCGNQLDSTLSISPHPHLISPCPINNLPLNSWLKVRFWGTQIQTTCLYLMFMCWKSNFQSDSIKKWSLWDVIRSWG